MVSNLNSEAAFDQTNCLVLLSRTGWLLGFVFMPFRGPKAPHAKGAGPEFGRRRPDGGAQKLSTRVPPSIKSD